MNLSRRGFLTGIIAACAAPAILRSGLIMPIKPTLIIPETPALVLDFVEIELPGTGVQWVAVNGEQFAIRRGEVFPVPREYFEALRNSNLAMTWRDGTSHIERFTGRQEKDHVLNAGLAFHMSKTPGMKIT